VEQSYQNWRKAQKTDRAGQQNRDSEKAAPVTIVWFAARDLRRG
jgi:hypothetical protein